MPVIGVDLGGTKLALAVFSEEGRILHRRAVSIRQVTVTVTSLGADAGLYGAGWLALEAAMPQLAPGRVASSNT